MSNPMCLAGSSEQPQCAAERFKATIAELTRELAAAQERAMRAVKLQDQLYAVRTELAAAQAAQTVRADENERDVERIKAITVAYCAANDYINQLLQNDVDAYILDEIGRDYWRAVKAVTAIDAALKDAP